MEIKVLLWINPLGVTRVFPSMMDQEEEEMFESFSLPSFEVVAGTGAAFGTILAVLGGIAYAAQDRNSLAVPNGLAFSEFAGYEKWQMAGVSQTGNMIEVILANPAMIEAYEAGIPGNGRHFPDGAKMAKIHWNTKMNAEGFPVLVPDTLHDIDFMAKDGKRFADTGGWGYGQFNYNAASDALTPLGTGANCGYACHMAAAQKDYVFTGYPKR